MSRRPLAAVAAVVALGLVPAGAMATDGPLYLYEPSSWSVQAPFTASVLPGPVWQVQVPALAPATTGNRFLMGWACPVPGSEIAAIRFGALRTQAPSSLEIRVLATGATVFAEGDTGMNQSPSGGRYYDVGIPGGHCGVQLQLNQVEQRNQHARGYFIDRPVAVVRDVAPPAVTLRSLSAGWLGAGATLHAEWGVTDNFGADGVGQQRVSVGGQVRWSAVPGVGNHGADLSLDGLPDGVLPVQIVADGDGTGNGVAEGTVSVDRTAPAAGDLTSSSPGGPGVVTVSWRASDNLSGVATTQAEVNAATDGGTTGAWRPLGAPGAAGPQSVTATAAVADGVHAWRVRTIDAAGNVDVAAGPSPLIVDAHAPTVELHGVPSGWINALDLDLTATDALAPVLGLGATEIEVNGEPDGSDAGEWLRRSTSTGPAGRRVIPVGLQGLAPGRHALRVRVRNGGPFAAALATEVRATIRVDLEDPVVGRVGFAPAVGHPMRVAWTADDAQSGVATATVQWRQGGGWRTLASERAANGAGAMAVDVSALPNGPATLRLVVADAAGNVGARTGTAEIAGAGVGSIAGDPLGRLRSAHLVVSLRGARVERHGSRPVLVRRIVTGGAATLRGVLLDRRNRPIVGAEVQARGHRGALIGSGLTGRGGGFAFRVRPLAGGPVRVGVVAGRELLPHRTSADVRLEVRPLIDLGASALTVGAGGTVLFTGRISPSPSDLGLGSHKSIVLEWLDPVRRTWRPVVNDRLRSDGTYAIPWAFGLRGLTIPMRVSVPQDVGWPLLPARSRVVRVRVA